MSVDGERMKGDALYRMASIFGCCWSCIHPGKLRLETGYSGFLPQSKYVQAGWMCHARLPLVC